jgi:predicted transcriptional regulator
MGKSKTIYTLKEVLMDLGISPNQFAVEFRIRPNTIYKIVNNESPRLPLDTITTILDGLNQIADERNLDYQFEISDIVKYFK